MALLTLALGLAACNARSKAQADNLLAAGDPCDPTNDHELCVIESTYIRLGCSGTAGVWQLLGECTLTQTCEEYTTAAAPDRTITRCVEFAPTKDAVSTPVGDTVGSPDTATGTDIVKGNDAANDTAQDAASDANKSDSKTSNCGDGSCSGGETTLSCPQDCPAPKCGDGVCASVEACWLDCSNDGLTRLGCLKSKCPNQTSACLADDACVSVLLSFLQCMAGGCGGASNCFGVCQPLIGNSTGANSVATCGVTACFAAQVGQCGDGVCSGSETPSTCPKDCKPASTGSCAGLCGGASTDCHCDPPCVKANDCCADYVQQCVP